MPTNLRVILNRVSIFWVCLPPILFHVTVLPWTHNEILHFLKGLLSGFPQDLCPGFFPHLESTFHTSHSYHLHSFQCQMSVPQKASPQTQLLAEPASQMLPEHLVLLTKQLRLFLCFSPTHLLASYFMRLCLSSGSWSRQVPASKSQLLMCKIVANRLVNMAIIQS